MEINMLARLFCLLTLAFCALRAESQEGSSDEYRLRAELNRRYDDLRRQMVPGQDRGLSPLVLNFGMAAIKIMDFDEEKDVMTLYGWNQMSWKDVNLSWDPEDYGGITSLRIPSNLMWRPDIVLYSSLQLGSGQDESILAVVYSDGTVHFIPPAVATVHCNVNSSFQLGEGHDHSNHGSDEWYYHHDGLEWACDFKYGSWVYDGSTVSLGVFNNATTIDMSYFIADPHYEVLSTDAKVNTKYYSCCPDPYVDITFTMRIGRK